MATTTVFTQNNVVLAATPPDYFVPSATGGSVPAGKSSWQVIFDCTGLPANQLLLTVTLQYQRPQWIDAAGVVHPANEWLDDFGSTLFTTSPKTGQIASMGSTIGAVNLAGGMVEPYPTHFRFHVTSCPGWTVPSITLNLS